MPAALSYPGVYIEEIPSGVHPITGIGTSITAFVGAALRGPTDKATTINSFGDFERIFGGLWVKSTLGYAVRDFYLNGGAQAIIVRLFHSDGSPVPEKTPLESGKLQATDPVFTFEAAEKGISGRNLRLRIDGDVSQAAADTMGLAKTDLFNLTVNEVGPDGVPVRSEQIRNATVTKSTRRIDNILETESSLLRWRGAWPAKMPDVKAIHDAEKKLAEAEEKLKDEQAKDPQVQADIDNAQKAVDDARKPLDVVTTDNLSKIDLEVAAARKKLIDATIAGNQSDINTAKTELAAAKSKLATEAKTADGDGLTTPDDFTPPNGETDKKGIYALEDADLFNLLCLPPYNEDGDTDTDLISAAAAYCEKRRAMLLVDPPSGWKDVAGAKAGVGGVGTSSKNAALFFPRLKQRNPLRDNQVEDFVPCGAVAGVFARTDTTRGVWKAPAGLEATLVGVPELSVPLNDAENGELNPLGINCLRSMPAAGRIIWGSRTLQGNDRLASEWKYVPVRRTALFIEEGLYRGTQWVVFEPNDEPLWAQIRLNVGAFMQSLFRQGAFQGKTPAEAYFVKCDKETTTQDDINHGIVNVLVGFAPLRPAEFVVIKLQQMAGQIQT
jgi:phage tail sheath protein FI